LGSHTRSILRGLAVVGRPITSDRTNILSFSVVANLPPPAAALPQHPLLSAHINEAIIDAFRRIMGHNQARQDLIWRSRA
jgi:hypothetical protein